jgi:drug/metabolite transporter (DMT)-like permease
MVVGLLMFAGDYGLIYWAEQYIASGLTAVLFATLPLMTLFIARAYIPGERITTGKLGSSVLALVGTVALFADQLRVDTGGRSVRCSRCSAPRSARRSPASSASVTRTTSRRPR